MKLDTKGKWSPLFPVKRNDKDWFFVKVEKGNYKAIYIREVRVDCDGSIYLAPECHEGITKRAFGTRLSFYSPKYTQFCGPIQMPPNYRN